MEIRERVKLLRKEMATEGYDAYLITSSDPHQSEYPPARWRSRAWISGFDGSAGTVVVTAHEAGLWTDSRYFLAAQEAIAGTGFRLFREGDPGVPGYAEWLQTTLAEGDVLGLDSDTTSLSEYRELIEGLDSKQISVHAGPDLVDRIWRDRPSLPTEAVFAYEPRFSGQSRGEKLFQIRARMETTGVTAHVLSTLDDIAWTLNLRGSDVPYNPVFVAHLMVMRERAILFADASKFPEDLVTELGQEDVVIEPYLNLPSAIASLETGSVLLYSPDHISVGLSSSVRSEVTRMEAPNPSSLMKAQKNSIELENLCRAMLRDGVAMVRFLSWLTASIELGEVVTELTAEQQLSAFRSEGEHFVSESFRTISAYRGHGAVVHYAASEESASRLESAGLFLIDSGAQYLDGTTDITRTVTLGEPTEEQRREYTLVLKAHVTLATIRFPAGTTGLVLDAICRQHLWRHGLNYGHGTGHGVGFFLNVHEGPQRLAQRRSMQPLLPGMIISNEPGLYRPERYGIRIENLVVVEEDESNEFGHFYRLRTLTLCPFDRSLIDQSLLSAQEIDWINAYHRGVRDKLRGSLDPDLSIWLDEACAPLE
ncbi:MAG: aminopeptidase P family protein [Spirochaetota bacterium]